MPPSHFPSPDIIAIYDEKQEIVFYNWEVFPELTKEQQRQVYGLTTKYLRLTTTER